MKKIITSVFLLLTIVCQAQSDFKIEKTDSVSKSKSQIYADTKLFIAEEWKSAQAVVQNDDKESGVILIKGAAKYERHPSLVTVTYWYKYTVAFYMKEGKYRIILNNIYCESAYCNGNKWPDVEVCNNCEYPGYLKASMGKNGWQEFQNQIKSDMQSIVSSYEDYIKKPSKLAEQW